MAAYYLIILTTVTSILFSSLTRPTIGVNFSGSFDTNTAASISLSTFSYVLGSVAFLIWLRLFPSDILSSKASRVAL